MIPSEKELLNNLGKIAYTLDKAYLSRLSTDFSVLCFDEKYNQNEAICYANNIRAIRVERWVFDKEEKPGECFKNVLSTFADGDHTIALVVKRKVNASEMYFVVKNEGEGRNEDSGSNVSLLDDSLKGNFPGTHTKILDVTGTEIAFDFSKCKSVAVMTNIPSEFSEDFITQGIDKLLNGIVPQKETEEYSVVFLAESLTQDDIREILSGYEDIATAIVPFLQYQFQMGKSKVDTQGETKSISNTKSISESVFKTHSVNVGANGSISRGSAISRTIDTKGIASAVLSTAGGVIGGFVGGPAGALVGKKIGDIVGTLAPSNTNTKSKGASAGLSVGYGYSWGESKTVSNGTTDTTGTSSSISLGESENTTYTYKSYMVSNLMDKLEKTMERIDESQGTGLWKYSAYVISNDSKVSKNVASYLRAITQGSESYMEPAFVQEWSYINSNGVTPFNEIMKYVSHFTHPVFVSLKNDSDAMLVTPTSYVSTDKLGYIISFPRKSIQGIPVIEGVQFGREPHALIGINEDLEIGSGYHMNQVIKSTRVKLSKEELTKHTFITGSTGAGKSNTIYKLLSSLGEQKVKFLVIEPAKGEYKEVLGKRRGVTTYGTNPKLKDIELLKINPFSFPPSIHVLEHMDRIIEIFNVCWPMYAAMPAILKDAVERSYILAGWNLETSENRFSSELFPTFNDVVKQIKVVLAESDYSDDNKGDYTGSLVTRLKSLTNGINGLIFTSDNLPDEKLFDSNVIVDLSRVGSTETKSLIMGLLVLKLQEHRMDQRANNPELNSDLKHITVLEEAHNLLRRTSTEQSSEGSNLLGKSVEMLANSIAEMRTYGEGFVIADQSPGLLDMSVIRNTNTKIIMKLPDFSDRELVGKSAGMSDNQIGELSRIERGVAAISQSDWLEPVLCMVDEYEVDGEPFATEMISSSDENKDNLNVECSLLECIMNNEIYRKGDRVDIKKIKDAAIRSKIDTTVKCDLLDYIAAEGEKAVKALRCLIYDFLKAESAIGKAKKCNDIVEWVHTVAENLTPSLSEYSNRQIDLVMALLIYEQSLRDTTYNDILCRFTEIYRKEGGVY